ncbi:unnamed protein product [Trifolium pratense]|uniref:Uncharacterized protein n=1 Tax=Trifolium pratense TaxID=57577 RepID=A0ACB0L8P9_TRIPR|nr:unnamed protein product [Trifolium pratense]
MEITITQPDDFHLHLRDGALLEAVTPHSAKHFQRAIIMPNLKPPITTTSSAISYRESILKAVPKTSNFTPLMTLYLTDVTTPHEIQLAKKSGVVYGVKLFGYKLRSIIWIFNDGIEQNYHSIVWEVNGMK